ncbi:MULTISPECIES: hypothetical protein [Rhodococcus]|uniref:hypothetical protein n=1 Tax=Rhodococcus TaxID=1827 RepID=UPI00056B7F24|nr:MULTISPECIES: hypothetical protein [Rhodococcus]MCD5419737.1 hypothetical protein [Rhodococcus pyridinivorans]
MSILNRPLTEQELASAGIEPAPIAHETFTQIFAVKEGELEVLDPFSAKPVESESESDEHDEDTPPTPSDEDTPPKPMRLTPAVVVWLGTYACVIGAIIHYAGGGR